MRQHRHLSVPALLLAGAKDPGIVAAAIRELAPDEPAAARVPSP